jgi:prevent-host-death family protein
MSNLSTLSLHPEYALSAIELRQRLGEVLERVHYQFVQFRITRKDKPMARLVNEAYMQAIEHLIDEDPALAETLEVMMDKSAMQAIRQGEQEIAEGKLLPLDAILEG